LKYVYDYSGSNIVQKWSIIWKLYPIKTRGFELDDAIWNTLIFKKIVNNDFDFDPYQIINYIKYCCGNLNVYKYEYVKQIIFDNYEFIIQKCKSGVIELIKGNQQIKPKDNSPYYQQ
jgi:hypothetical protein